MLVSFKEPTIRRPGRGGGVALCFFSCFGLPRYIPTSKHNVTRRSRLFVFPLQLNVEMRKHKRSRTQAVLKTELVKWLCSIINFSNATFDKHFWRSVPKIRKVIACYCYHISLHRRVGLCLFLSAASGPQTPRFRGAHQQLPLAICEDEEQAEQARLPNASNFQLFSM